MADSDPQMFWLDSEQRVRVDARCQWCHYELRTLKLSDACPECSARVRRSVRPDLLRFGDARRLRQAATGAWLVVAAVGAIPAVLFVIAQIPPVWPTVPGVTVRPGFMQRFFWPVSFTCMSAAFAVGIALIGRAASTRRIAAGFVWMAAPFGLFAALANLFPLFTGGRLVRVHATFLIATGVMLAICILAVLWQVRAIAQRSSLRFAKFSGIVFGSSIPAAFFLTFLSVCWGAIVALGTPAAPYALAGTVNAPYCFYPTDPDYKPEYIIVDRHGGMTVTTTVPADVPIDWGNDAVTEWSNAAKIMAVPAFYYCPAWIVPAFILMICLAFALRTATRQAERDRAAFIHTG